MVMASLVTDGGFLAFSSFLPSVVPQPPNYLLILLFPQVALERKLEHDALLLVGLVLRLLVELLPLPLEHEAPAPLLKLGLLP